MHITWIIIVLTGTQQAEVFLIRIYSRYVMCFNDIVADTCKSLCATWQLSAS